MSKPIKVCLHCGTPFTPSSHLKDFCCKGCEYVYGLIHNEGLDTFYELRRDVTKPAGKAVFQKRDYSWLNKLAEEAETTEASFAHLTLNVQGISCAGCVWLIEKLYQQESGALAIQVSASDTRMRIRWQKGEFALTRFAQTLQSFGYFIAPQTEWASTASAMLFRRLVLCSALTINSALVTSLSYLGMERWAELQGIFTIISIVCATLSVLIGGTYFMNRSLMSLRHGIVHKDLFFSISIIAVYLFSFVSWQLSNDAIPYLDFVSILILLMLGHRWLNERALSEIKPGKDQKIK